MRITCACTAGHHPQVQLFAAGRVRNRRHSARIACHPSVGGLMIGELGLPEILLILGIALLLFGPKKLGDLGKSLGEGIRSFRSAIKDEPPTTSPEPSEAPELAEKRQAS